MYKYKQMWEYILIFLSFFLPQKIAQHTEHRPLCILLFLTDGTLETFSPPSPGKHPVFSQPGSEREPRLLSLHHLGHLGFCPLLAHQEVAGEKLVQDFHFPESK